MSIVHQPGDGGKSEPFNPWRGNCGFYAPDIVACSKNLTDGQKRLYERAVRWAGRQGTFWRSFETMASALGKSVRQVKSDMAKLEFEQLITHVRRGNRQSNLYYFRRHEMFPSDVQPTALQKAAESSQKPDGVKCSPASSEVQSSVKSDVQPTALEFSPLNFVPELRKTTPITPDELQKPQFARESMRSVSSKPSENQTPKPPIAPPATKTDLARLRRVLTRYMNGGPLEGGEQPPPEFEQRVVLAARTASVQQIIDLLERKFTNEAYRPGGKYGSTKWAWFLKVVGAEFSPAEQGRYPGYPAPVPATAEPGLPHGIEAIELPDDPSSLVTSHRCKCGVEIRFYGDDHVEGVCRCA